MKRFFLTLLLLTAAPLAFAQSLLGNSTTVKVEGFSTQGSSPDGKIVWELDGKDAELSVNITEVRDFTLNIQLKDGMRYAVRSFFCRYVNALHEIKSSSPLILESEAITASGIGYDIFLDSHILRIRSCVRINVKKSKVSSEKNLVPEIKEK